MKTAFIQIFIVGVLIALGISTISWQSAHIRAKNSSQNNTSKATQQTQALEQYNAALNDTDTNLQSRDDQFTAEMMSRFEEYTKGHDVSGDNYQEGYNKAQEVNSLDDVDELETQLMDMGIIPKNWAQQISQ